jgi:membrane dipeptidase
VVGWNDATETGNVTAELKARGYSDADVAKIWSGNLVRVWRAAEETAAALAAENR